LYGSTLAPASDMPNSGACIMTLSIAPGLDSNGTCRATEFTRGGSIPRAAPADRTAWRAPRLTWMPTRSVRRRGNSPSLSESEWSNVQLLRNVEGDGRVRERNVSAAARGL
jgi:hypothetical protein